MPTRSPTGREVSTFDTAPTLGVRQAGTSRGSASHRSAGTSLQGTVLEQERQLNDTPGPGNPGRETPAPGNPNPGPPDLAVAAVVIAGAALTAAVVPDWTVLAIPLGVVAAGLALGGLLLPRRGRRWSALILAFALLVTVLGALRLAAADRPADATTPAPVGSQPPQARPSVDPDATVITYEIVTDGMSVTHLSYVDVIDGQPQMVEKLGVPPPFQHVIVLPPESSLELSELSVTGLGGATSTRTMCTLTVDGAVVSRQTSDGSYGMVSCSVPAT